MPAVEEMPVAEIAASSGAAAAMLVHWVAAVDLVGTVAHLVDVGLCLPAYAGRLVLVRGLVAQRAALPLVEALLVVAFAEPGLVELGIQLL